VSLDVRVHEVVEIGGKLDAGGPATYRGEMSLTTNVRDRELTNDAEGHELPTSGIIDRRATGQLQTCGLGQNIVCVRRC
jgi:hypothetical protein